MPKRASLPNSVKDLPEPACPMHITQQFVLSNMRPTVEAFTKENMSELCCRMSKIRSYSNSSELPVFSSVRAILLLSNTFIIFSSRSKAFSRSAILTLDSFCTSFFFIIDRQAHSIQTKDC